MPTKRQFVGFVVCHIIPSGEIPACPYYNTLVFPVQLVSLYAMAAISCVSDQAAFSFFLAARMPISTRFTVLLYKLCRLLWDVFFLNLVCS